MLLQAVMTPLAPRKSHKTLAVGISLIWSLGTIAALPAALFSRLYRVERWGGGGDPVRQNQLKYLLVSAMLTKRRFTPVY